MQQKIIDNLNCLCVKNSEGSNITYILYPLATLGNWVEDASRRYNTSIVVITGMDWENDLTPWPAKGVPAGTPDFEGNAAAFLARLKNLATEIERGMGLPASISRNLVGVSLSGLFTLWQWTQTNFFQNIACLSGSFWYANFDTWFASQNLSDRQGIAYFLLGDREPYSNVKEFNSAGINTQKIVDQLQAEGVRVRYDIVRGNHFQHPIERLNRAMQALT